MILGTWSFLDHFYPNSPLLPPPPPQCPGFPTTHRLFSVFPVTLQGLLVCLIDLVSYHPQFLYCGLSQRCQANTYLFGAYMLLASSAQSIFPQILYGWISFSFFRLSLDVNYLGSFHFFHTISQYLNVFHHGTKAPWGEDFVSFIHGMTVLLPPRTVFGT